MSKQSTPSRPTIMRSLGEFFGHIVHGIKTDPTRSSRAEPTDGAEKGHVVDQRLEEHVEQTEHGPVVYRRTTIDEVIMPRGERGGAEGAGKNESKTDKG